MTLFNDWISKQKKSKGIFIANDYSLVVGDSPSRRLVFAQLIYWFSVDSKNKSKLKIIENGKLWLAKTIQELADECGMAYGTVKTILSDFNKEGIIIKKQAVFYHTKILHIHLNESKICDILNQKSINSNGPKLSINDSLKLANSNLGLNEPIVLNQTVPEFILGFSLYNREYNENTTERLNISKDIFNTTPEVVVWIDDSKSSISDDTEIRNFSEKPPAWFCSAKNNSAEKFPGIGDCQKILNEWNINAKKISDISTHKSIASKLSCEAYNGVNNATRPIQHYLLDKLEKYSADEIKKAILNYFQILLSEKHYYNFKHINIARFIKHKNFETFLDVNNPFEFYRMKSNNPYQDVAHSINFIAYQFDHGMKLKSKNSFMSVPMSIIWKKNVEMVWQEIRIFWKKGSYTIDDYINLEECIACLIFRKENMNLLIEMVEVQKAMSAKLYKKHKDKFDGYLARISG